LARFPLPLPAALPICRTRKHVLIGHPALDLFLRYVGELLRAVVEELDAVVRRRVMRRADDRPRDELTSFGEVPEAGGRDVADKPDRKSTRLNSSHQII